MEKESSLNDKRAQGGCPPFMLADQFFCGQSLYVCPDEHRPDKKLVSTSTPKKVFPFDLSMGYRRTFAVNLLVLFLASAWVRACATNKREIEQGQGRGSLYQRISALKALQRFEANVNGIAKMTRSKCGQDNDVAILGAVERFVRDSFSPNAKYFRITGYDTLDLTVGVTEKIDSSEQLLQSITKFYEGMFFESTVITNQYQWKYTPEPRTFHLGVDGEPRSTMMIELTAAMEGQGFQCRVDDYPGKAYVGELRLVFCDLDSGGEEMKICGFHLIFVH